MTDDSFYHLALSQTPGIGNANGKGLVSYLGGANQVFFANKSQLTKVPGIGIKTAEAIVSKSGVKSAESIVKKCESQSIKILNYTEKDYPIRLKQLIDSPNIVYFKGNGMLNPERSLAIVGTRKASKYGLEATLRLISECARYSAQVVSGLAYGIDVTAHKTALDTNQSTIAVIAGGIDKLYPKTHQKYADAMLESGGILTEHPPGTKPDAHLFPARNRIIAGLADATIVIEAAIKGGALITANIADSYNRPVFAVPGNLDSPTSMGCNKLIQSQTALIYTGPETLEYNLNWTKGSNRASKEIDIQSLDLDDNQSAIISILKQEGPLDIDTIAWKTQIQVNQLAGILLELEFSDLIRSNPGKKYELKY